MKTITFVLCFVFQSITLEATPPGDPQLFPKMPDMNAFPPGAMLIEFEGNSDLPVELGKILELKNVKFQMFEDGTVFKVDKIKLLPKTVASKG